MTHRNYYEGGLVRISAGLLCSTAIFLEKLLWGQKNGTFSQQNSHRAQDNKAVASLADRLRSMAISVVAIERKIIRQQRQQESLATGR